MLNALIGTFLVAENCATWFGLGTAMSVGTYTAVKTSGKAK